MSQDLEKNERKRNKSKKWGKKIKKGRKDEGEDAIEDIALTKQFE